MFLLSCGATTRKILAIYVCCAGALGGTVRSQLRFGDSFASLPIKEVSATLAIGSYLRALVQSEALSFKLILEAEKIKARQDAEIGQRLLAMGQRLTPMENMGEGREELHQERPSSITRAIEQSIAKLGPLATHGSFTLDVAQDGGQRGQEIFIYTRCCLPTQRLHYVPLDEPPQSCKPSETPSALPVDHNFYLWTMF